MLESVKIRLVLPLKAADLIMLQAGGRVDKFWYVGDECESECRLQAYKVGYLQITI